MLKNNVQAKPNTFVATRNSGVEQSNCSSFAVTLLEQGQEASEKVTVMTLKELSESAGFSMTETAEAVADVVNAMVVT